MSQIDVNFWVFFPHIVPRSWGQSCLALPDGQRMPPGVCPVIAGWHVFPVSAAASLSDSCRESWYFITLHVSYLWETQRALRIFFQYLIVSGLSEVGSRKCYLHFADVTAEAKPNLMKVPQRIKASRALSTSMPEISMSDDFNLILPPLSDLGLHEFLLLYPELQV